MEIIQRLYIIMYRDSVLYNNIKRKGMRSISYLPA